MDTRSTLKAFTGRFFKEADAWRKRGLFHPAIVSIVGSAYLPPGYRETSPTRVTRGRRITLKCGDRGKVTWTTPVSGCGLAGRSGTTSSAWEACGAGGCNLRQSAFLLFGVLLHRLDVAFHVEWLATAVAMVGTAILATVTGWAASFRIPGRKPLQVLRAALTGVGPALTIEKSGVSAGFLFAALPPRSMVGQLPLEQHIGVRIPGGQPI